MRGLRTKLFDLRCALLSVSAVYDVVILVETWLIDSISDSELGFDDFNVFRADRCDANSNCLKGGGVLIAVRNCLLCRAVRTTVSNVEQLFVDIRLDHNHLVVGAVYIPPSSNCHVYEAHCLTVEEVMIESLNANFLIVGDYNLPHTRWMNSDGLLQCEVEHSHGLSERANHVALL